MVPRLSAGEGLVGRADMGSAGIGGHLPVRWEPGIGGKHRVAYGCHRRVVSHPLRWLGHEWKAGHGPEPDLHVS